MLRLAEYIEQIGPSDAGILEKAKARWDSGFKTIDGLGLLETLVSRIAAIQGTEEVRIDKRTIVVMCADNGVVDEKVTQTGREITAAVAKNMAAGQASINRMALAAGADVLPVDIGIAQDMETEGLLSAKIAYGTGNICREAAMSREQAEQAVLTGIRLAGMLKQEGCQLLGTGEMGIGNTTTSSAIASVLLQRPAEQVTGTGAGLSREGLLRKMEVIRKAVALHKPYCSDEIELLRRLGGYDIAGLTGLFLGGAVYHLPVVIDGVIAAVAALLAVRMKKDCIDFMLPSHQGKEPASRLLLEELGLKAPIHAELALGEGSGAVALMPLLDMALHVYRNEVTFKSQRIKAYERFR